ncbi:MAG: translation initiation factor IF-2 [Deltaproteobacteria bacterium]|nr:translation initiation factor IF-2 [Deltaproteobacteria bacterium]MDH3896308.1 translation initiation factor IF-2 [Deltaproteobacteria bacterium]MDH3963407.1 translation initiation factor IF-2 [Deltaproteobacteria bacterium]
MAKLRVYELAKELEIPNTDLLERIESLGIQIKGHMSSLDEEQAQLLRDTVTGRAQQLIEEKRVRRGIIRRRRKIVKAEPPAEEVETEVAAETAPPVEEQAEAVVEAELPPPVVEGEAPEVEPEKPEKVEPDVEVAKEEKPAKKVKEKKVKKPRRRGKKEAAAKIIKLPERGAEVVPEPKKAEPKIEESMEAVEKVVEPVPTPPGPEAETTKRPGKPKKKKGKRARVDESEEGPVRRGLPSRRKEVVTGDDLYARRRGPGRMMKGRKAARARAVAKDAKQTEITIPKAAKRRVKLDEAITVASLAKRMGVKAREVITQLMELGLMATVNQAIDFDTASLVATEFNYEAEKTGFEEATILQAVPDKKKDLKPRPPVVTIMGHVDHGKTSLLDAVRQTKVTEGEAGGITQHIGAYNVKLDAGQVVFLDTPGHEAFTAMRARGARVTDLVVLVVAADDGVMQQTVEAINHAQAAEVPILVAINKIDKANADPDRVKRELAERGLNPEEWGGDTTMVEVSAKEKTGLDELLELILLQAELMELKANPDKKSRGRVVEARLDRGKGPLATVLVQEGTLRAGDPFVCGTFYGRVRAMLDDRGRKVAEVTPSMPVEVHGISGVPHAGDELVVVNDEKQAKQVAAHRQLKSREAELSRATKVTLDNLFERIKEGETKELRIVLKADVQGSLEAITDSLNNLSTEEIKVNIIHSAAGAVTETDVMLASASDAITIGFSVRASQKAQELADAEKVDLRFYDVIYQLVGEVKDAMEGMLDPIYKEHSMGRAEVLKTFHASRVGTVAGSMVNEGRVERGAKIRVLRDNVVINDSKIASLRRYKDEVKEVKAGQDCGIIIENFNDVKIGDILETYTIEEIKAVLEPGGNKSG